MGKTQTGGDGHKGLLILAAAMALALAALTYFLFVVHAPEDKQTSSAAGSQASTTPVAPRWLVPPPRPIASGETDLCGHGWVNQDEVEGIRAEARAAADRTFSLLKDKLAASPRERESALGLYLQRSTESLIRLASASRDPQVYALAFLSCGYSRSGACESLSAEQWAKLEPDNAVPWLLVASAPYNGITRDDAIYRASAAQRVDAHFPDFLGMLQWPEIRGQAPQTRSVLAEDLSGLRLTLPTLPLSPFYRFCNVPSVAEPSHMSICNNLAKLFLDRDRTMIGLTVGVKLAQSADWSPDVVKSLAETKTAYQAAYQAALAGRMPQTADRVHSDCEEQAAFEHWAADIAGLGDRGVAMKYIEETAEKERR
jgi:hypothetical protein